MHFKIKWVYVRTFRDGASSIQYFVFQLFTDSSNLSILSVESSNARVPRRRIETPLVKNIDQGTEPLCPGEYGREALEIAIALRESDLRGSEKMELPLANRSLKSR